MGELAQLVAEEVRAAQGRQRVTGRELARRVGEPNTTVARWLRGDTPMGVDELDAVADALGVEVSDLIAAAKEEQRRRRDGDVREFPGPRRGPRGVADSDTTRYDPSPNDVATTERAPSTDGARLPTAA